MSDFGRTPDEEKKEYILTVMTRKNKEDNPGSPDYYHRMDAENTYAKMYESTAYKEALQKEFDSLSPSERTDKARDYERRGVDVGHLAKPKNKNSLFKAYEK
jgi:hypothetical protein